MEEQTMTLEVKLEFDGPKTVLPLPAKLDGFLFLGLC